MLNLFAYNYDPYFFQSLVDKASASGDNYDVEKDQDLVRDGPVMKDENKEVIFRAGQSKRVWNELYKVGLL